jgi:hypothetical protein
MNQRATPAAEFAAELRQLYEAAGSPKHAVLVRQGGAQNPPVRLNVKSLSDWLGGVSVPSRPIAVRFLVEYLQPRAVRHGGYQRRPVDWWLSLHQRAWQERHAGRGGRPRTRNVGKDTAARPRWRIGRVPPRAQSLQARQVEADLYAMLTGGQTSVLTQVLSGLGGVGKTQLAAGLARRWWREGDVDLLLWVSAESREAILTGYAQAAGMVAGAPAEDAPQAAGRLLIWLEETDLRWLVVLDDVADPGDVKGLWPPPNPAGRTLVTTRRRDAVLSTAGRRLVTVGLFTEGEAVAYLRERLGDDDRVLTEATELAADLGLLPLALAQAAAYLLDRGLSCVEYRRRWADHRRRLSDLVPEGGALPDDHRATVEATWSLSIDLADRLHPAGLARPLLELASVLDPNGIPASVLTGPAALVYLTDRRDHEDAAPVDAEQANDALHCLHRLSLANVDAGSTAHTVRVHGLVQRATREQINPDRLPVLVRAAADAVLHAWPEVERDRELGQALRANTASLQQHGRAWLWTPSPHQVLFRAGDSLGESGLVVAAVAYWEGLLRTATEELGSEHPDTLGSRYSLASWRGQAGDAAGAIAALEELHADTVRILSTDRSLVLRIRTDLAWLQGQAGDASRAAAAFEELLAEAVDLLGPNHRSTLAIRHELAHWHALTGDPAGAAVECEQLLSVQLRVLGPDHPATLGTRNDLACWRGRAGDPAGAADACEKLLADEIRVLGPDHPDTLITRTNIGHWHGEAGNCAKAVAICQELVTDMLRILGPDHPTTLNTCSSLVRWQSETADPLSALKDCERLLADMLRILGPAHPHTLNARNNLARCRGKAGDAAGAAEECEQLLVDMMPVLGAGHPHTVSARTNLATWQSQISADKRPPRSPE